MNFKNHTKDQEDHRDLKDSKSFKNFKDLGEYYRNQKDPMNQKDQKDRRNQKDRRDSRGSRNSRDFRDSRDLEVYSNVQDDRDYIFFKLSRILCKHQLLDTDIEKVLVKVDLKFQYLHVPNVLSVLRKTPVRELAKLNSSLRFILKNGDMINCMTDDKNSVVDFIYKENPRKLVDIVTGDSAVKKLLLS